MQLAGIDGCRRAWVVARSDHRLRRLEFHWVEDLEPLFGEADRGGLLIVIDIPIGLPENGPRRADVAARDLVRERRSSVFPPPCRGTLDAVSHSDGCRLNREACATGMSLQSFAIVPKIREIDRLMTPRRQAHIREGHPEVTFALLARRPLAHPKKTAAGREERLALLRDAGVALAVDHERAALRPHKVGRDDVIDAAACLVTAHRLAHSQAGVLPVGVEQRDARVCGWR